MVNIGVVCRAKAFEETRKKLGWWSYPTPGLTWDFYPCEDGDTIDLRRFKGTHDVIVYEDWVWVNFTNHGSVPVFAVIVDSNTSSRRLALYQDRIRKSRAQAVLVDQDELGQFRGLGVRVYRWSYGVNENVFYPREKTTDVAYYVAKTPGRNALALWLDDEMCVLPLTYDRGRGMEVDVYASRVGAAKILVHKSTRQRCRSHRFFDALASRCCLLSDPVDLVPEDQFLPNVHYLEWDSTAALKQQILSQLDTDRWKQIANAGYDFVMSRHTWRHRAAEFLQIAERELCR